MMEGLDSQNVRDMVRCGIAAMQATAKGSPGWFAHEAGAAVVGMMSLSPAKMCKMGQYLDVIEPIFPDGDTFYVGADEFPRDSASVARGKVAAVFHAARCSEPLRSGHEVREQCKEEYGLSHWKGAVGAKVLMNGKPNCMIVCSVSGAKEEQDEEIAKAGLCVRLGGGWKPIFALP